ncbi:hypothetical protein QTG54_003306 [Skeletonema marinoi]|uniref:RING-type domain-containing protein n=1 Tax=Skeletonema marinoi TaxID=267567 RepID=A0AAD8YFY2_9STRA|nr:hypothetical protein QTG54_003306 [Skeletonema marinoi]
MFGESANFEKAEAEANNANMQPFTMNSRNLHSLFNDNPPNTAHGNLRMGNSTTDHYHRPAAGAGGIKDQAKAATVGDTTLGGQTDNQTLSFTLIFLSLMVVYIGFCCHYRKVKVRRSYDDSAHSQNANNNNNRQRRQRDNQAVLDESSSAANRAAADSEEQRKLEERKVRIGEVLWTRLIVDDEDEEGGHVAEPYLNVNGGGGDEENQVNANDDKIHEKSDLVDEEMGSEAAVVVGKTLAQDEDAPSGALATKQEEDEEAPYEETTIATVPSSSEETISTIPSNVPTIGTSPSSSTAVAPSTPPSSPFRKYADALSCNNCHHHATNYCNNQHINCNNDATTSSSPANSKSTSNNSSLTTITLSDIQQTYGDECNICLSTFQVGDRAAWSKHHFNGCVHVFHDECMKRWLLVRDGCPICRRLYLGEGTMKKGLVPTPQDDDGGGVDNDDGEGESGRDLESGGGGMGNAAIITVEEE